MRLFVVAPMFSAMGDGELERRSQAWNEWWETNGEDVQKRYGVSSWNLLDLLPGRDIHIGGTRPVRIELPKDPKSLVQKGLAVRFSILAALDWVDRHGVEARSNSVFALLDGSGAFDYANIYKLLDTLTTPPLPQVVFGLRPPGESGMVEWRKAIEDFENFLVMHQLPDTSRKRWARQGGLPDGQAGCWAFRMSSIKELAISANSYEIEFDLLASALLRELRISFTEPLTMADRRTTDFGGNVPGGVLDICMKKLAFIQYKLEMTDADMIPCLKAFKEEFFERYSAMPRDYYESVMAKYRPL